MTRFSVVTPVYNAARYLEKCVESLLGQSDAPEYELIFVDDGSTDGSGEILDAYVQRNAGKVRVIHTENRGTIYARKTAIDLAEGEYVLFCDADDLMAQDAFSVIDGRLRESEADILIYNHAEFHTGEEPKPTGPLFADGTLFIAEPDTFSDTYSERFPDRPVFTKEILLKMMISGWSLNNLWIKAIRSELLKNDPTEWSDFADNPMSDDLLCSLWPMTQAKRLAYCAQPLYLYRRTDGGLTQSFNETRYRRLLDGRVLKQLRSYMDTWQLNGEEDILLFERRRLLQRIDTAMAFFRHADGSEAQREVLSRDWFGGLENDRKKRKAVLKTLDPKRYIQYRLIKGKHAWFIAMLSGRGRKR